MVKNASKDDVYKKLQESLDWCNSNNDSAQARFNAVVDSILMDSERNADMKAFFPVLLRKSLSGYKPGIALKQAKLELEPADFLQCYFESWVKKYANAWKTLPSERQAGPKGAATDPALIKMVEARAHSEQSAVEWATIHNLFMSAENVGGNLLEEYIYDKVKDYDWIWCRGEVLTAVDFCNKECTNFIQIKNKSNTENSSGKGFREDHHAEKWYRMEASRHDGEIVTRWPELIDIIQAGTQKKVPLDLMNENSYLQFVKKASEKNPNLITGREK